MNCKNCGGRMVGDGISVPIHCETIPEWPLHEPDAQPEYCEEWDAEAWVATPSREDVLRAQAESHDQSDELESRFYEALDEIARLRAELEAANGEAEALRVDAEKAIIDVAIKALTQGYYSGRIVTGAGVTSLSASQWAADFAESTPLFKGWIDAAIDAARGKDMDNYGEALSQILRIADGYVSEGELPVMVVIQTICKQALVTGPGYVRVPVEPTEEMIDSGIDAGRIDEEDVTFMWARMLAATKETSHD